MFMLYCGMKGNIYIRGYSDASYQTDRDGFMSQSGFVFTLNGGTVTWKSFMIVDPTTESEYLVALDTEKEAVWIKKFTYKKSCGS